MREMKAELVFRIDGKAVKVMITNGRHAGDMAIQPLLGRPPLAVLLVTAAVALNPRRLVKAADWNNGRP